MSVPAVISFRDVSFSFDTVPVLESVNVAVAEHELVSVVGPNGGGKTTFLKLLLGLLRPNAGTVQVFGNVPSRVRSRIGYMPQHTLFDPHFPVTVMDVVLMGRLDRRQAGPYATADKEAAMKALAEVGLDELPHRPFADLSGGQRQRTLIARALVCEPDLLLLDEPMANLDIAAEGRFTQILQKLNRRMTILMASHDLGFVLDIVQTVICVNRRVIMHPTSNITGEIIRDIYGESLRMVRHDHRCAETGHEPGFTRAESTPNIQRPTPNAQC